MASSSDQASKASATTRSETVQFSMNFCSLVFRGTAASWITTAIVIALGTLGAAGPAASMFVVPTYLLLRLTTPVLPPIGHSWFCVQYPDDCRVHGTDFRRRNIRLTPQRWKELNSINSKINHQIIPENTIGYGTTDWIIAPYSGDCKSYAITKRHELLARGWPSRALLLAEVTLPNGEDHLVLLVRMAGIDLVLDNLDTRIRMATEAYRRWVRIEAPQNPRLWVRVQVVSAAAGRS